MIELWWNEFWGPHWGPTLAMGLPSFVVAALVTRWVHSAGGGR